MWVAIDTSLRTPPNRTQGTLADSGPFVLTGETTLNRRTLSSGLSTPGIAIEWEIVNENSTPYSRKM